MQTDKALQPSPEIRRIASRIMAASSGTGVQKATIAQVKAFARTGHLHPNSINASQCRGLFEGLGYLGVDPDALFMAQAHLYGSWAPILKFAPAMADHLRSKKGILALALTESESGSDVYALKTTAKEVKKGWYLNGEKAFITNAGIASHALVFTLGNRPNALHCFLVDLKTNGVSIKKMGPFVGLSGANIGGIRLRNVFVSKECQVGKSDVAGEIFRFAMAWERSLILSASAGVLCRLRERLLKELKGKKRNGLSLSDNPAVKSKLDEVNKRVLRIRELTNEAANTLDSGRNPIVVSLRTKIEASRSYQEASRTMLQLAGKEALLAGNVFERNLRDSLAASLYSGPNELLEYLLKELEA